MRIKNVAAPALPLAGRQYDAQYHNSVVGVLRLFFNKLTNFINVLAGETGGGGLMFPYGQFSSQTTQAVAVIDTPTLVALETTNYANDMTAVVGDGVHVSTDGVYCYAFELQLENPTTSIHEVTVWLRVNGVDVPYTGSVVSVPAKHGSISGYVAVARSTYITLEVGGYVELWWASTDTTVALTAIPAQTVPYDHPGMPAVSVTMTFVSATL